jgi:hypothetical protein
MTNPDTVLNKTNSPAPKENIWINLAFNIVIPAFILSKLSGADYLGPTMGLIVALSFPLFYGLMDFRKRHKVNVFSVLGIVSTLLTGTISLLELPPQYIAIKEAAIPSIIFLAVFISTFTSYPLVEKLIFNDAIFDLDKLKTELDNHHAQKRLADVLKNSSYMVSFSFLFSAVLNYVLAKTIVVSLPGTEAYNAELGKLTIYSYPVIALPCTVIMMGALFYLMHHLQKITGKDIEEFLLLGKPE